MVVASINISCNEYAKKIEAKLKKQNISVKLDLRNEKIGYKIREHSNAKIPIIFIIGENEIKVNSVAVRRLGSKKIEQLSLEDVINKLNSLQFLLLWDQ